MTEEEEVKEETEEVEEEMKVEPKDKPPNKIRRNNNEYCSKYLREFSLIKPEF